MDLLQLTMPIKMAITINEIMKHSHVCGEQSAKKCPQFLVMSVHKTDHLKCMKW